MKLTAKTHTDAGMLPVSETVNLLPDFSAEQAPSQIAGLSGPEESLPLPQNAGEGHLLTTGGEVVSLAETAVVPIDPDVRSQNI